MALNIPPEQFERALKLVQEMRVQVSRAFVGQELVVEQTVAAPLAGGHVLIEGVPGLGKTLLVQALAKTFSGTFARIQFTPDLMPADVTGHTLYDPGSGQFTTRRGPVFANLLLADEINRAPAKTQSALLEVMQEGQVTIEGQAFKLEPPFMVLATQNPIEQEGTYALPEAQLDRFLLKVQIDYPSMEEEINVLKTVTGNRIGDKLIVEQVQTILQPQVLSTLQMIAANLRVDDKVYDYALRIVRATRASPGIAVGAGPRGAIALIRVARAAAFLAGRDFVSPDDVKRYAIPALRHRVTPAPDLAIEGHTSDQLLADLLEKTEAPRL
ncbi:MAG: MoxR family ATPase [Ahniella sp.]|nr:MoxR family ATPase [Ahniella sp.]